MGKMILMAAVVLWAASSLLSNSGVESGGKVEEQRWNHRLLAYTVGHSDEVADYERSLAMWKDAFEERDMMLVNLGQFELQGAAALELSDEEKAVWRELWNVNDRSTRFVLVGKDGFPKAFQRDALDLPLFFDLIDTMPMRKLEMRERDS